MSLKFYLDEDIDISLAQALNNRGVNTITTQEAGNKGNTDSEQLLFAKKTKRIIITHNIRDFVILQKEFIRNSNDHGGIIVTNQIPVGILLKRVMKLWFALDADEMENRIEFLSNWE